MMGAGMAADAFALAFLIPNLFRRLFGEGAFSPGFVPLFSQRLHGEGGHGGGAGASPRRCWRSSCRC